MQKKWVYKLALILLVLGVLTFLVPAIYSASRGFIAGWRDAAEGVYEPFDTSTPDSVYYVSLGIIIIAILIIGINKILNKLDEIAKPKNEVLK